MAVRYCAACGKQIRGDEIFCAYCGAKVDDDSVRTDGDAKAGTAKIIKIQGDIISIGTATGRIEEVRSCDLNFVPQVGDPVEIFKTETQVMVVKAAQKEPVRNQAPPGGININITNDNQSGSGSVMAPGTMVGNKKVVSKVAYCLLAIFLGGIGAHKFYSGKIGMGILYLCFCWTCIPAVIALIEFFMALAQPADENGNILA
ncbi:MAG: TM2 domain-containing protein [Clostridiales bacterium]|nr:TM2 domain-containing protein [Clostridiales bacterium]